VLKKHKLKKTIIITFAGNERALGLYEKLGYKKTGSHKDGEHEYVVLEYVF
jgi:RimJ/RimL family protein N-acetyltransferase